MTITEDIRTRQEAAEALVREEAELGYYIDYTYRTAVLKSTETSDEKLKVVGWNACDKAKVKRWYGIRAELSALRAATEIAVAESHKASAKQYDEIAATRSGWADTSLNQAYNANDTSGPGQK